MAAKNDTTLQRQAQALLERARLPLDVDVSNGTARITGPVESQDEYQAALDLIKSVDGIQQVDDEIEISTTAPDSAFDDPSPEQGFEYAENLATDDEEVVEFEGDLAGDPGSEASDFQEAVEEAEPYFPPTDPVVQPTEDDQELEVVGGFEDTSMEETAEDPGLDSSETAPESPVAGDRDDETVREDILRELRQDALTTDLDVDVEVINGIAVLKGSASSLEDALNAEEVTWRVPGVRDVREEITIEM